MNECAVCGGVQWVCEDHKYRGEQRAMLRMPITVARAHHAPACNPCDRENLAKMPKGLQIILDKDGWRH
jgi:hypothetical protein